ncbi:choice-of-anchor D domain-containing protein [Seonamhaeicola sp. ML3]|uniref:choice-of-anchor D domain-containing protein n=1 Tax=Seonamhaeicola sp. ML3 TaxID=2937786 RepID=UPI00200D065F|nr:choice-of-anchor D domain-containing protein [Seonamhaeicola sp. ML3]
MENIALSIKSMALAIALSFLSLISFSQTSEVEVSVNWPSWSGDNRVEIYQPDGTLIATIDDGYDGSFGSYSTTSNLGCLTDDNNSPSGTGYYAIVYDSYGDGWNSGGTLTITSGGVTVLFYDENAEPSTNDLYNFGSGEETQTLYFEVANGGAACVSAPEINIQGNGNNIANGDTTPVVTDDTEFGSIENNTTLDHTFTIQNTGSETLNLTGTPDVAITGNAAFSILTQPSASAIVSGGGDLTFVVRFAPTVDVTNVQATISIANDDSDENPYTFVVQGSSYTPAPEINIQGNGNDIADGDITPVVTDDTEFGSIENNTTLDHTFTIQNTGTATLNLTGTPDVTITGDATFSILTQPSASAIVSGGGDLTFVVRFAPTVDVTNVQATISIANDDSDENPYTFVVQGSSFAPPPEIDIQGNSTSIVSGDTSPSAVDDTDFGDADIASGTVAHTFTIRNIGSGTLNLTGSSPYVSITGTHASDFTVTAIPGSTIGANLTTTFEITFNPSDIGLRTATISIANNDTDESTYTFNIQGTGTTDAQEINITGLGNTIASGDVSPSTTDNTDFGYAATGSGTNANTFVIENLGLVNTLNLTGSSPYVAISGTHAADFSVTTIPNNSISASSNTNFIITFAPSSDGLREATITIANNDVDESSYTFNIQGNGYTPPPCGTTVLHTADFETGMDGWTDGGTNAQRIFYASRSYSNEYSLEIRNQDAVGNNASVISPLFDFLGYDKIDFKFFFTSHNVEANEEFFIEYSNDSGSSWTTVNTYHCGNTSTFGKDGDFLYGDSIIYYGRTATILDSDFSFSAGSTSQFRIRCGANETNDLIYLDNFTITGTRYCASTTAPGGVTTNLDLWLKADQVDGANFGTDGAAVNQWFDNGNGNHAETTIPEQAPAYRNNATDNFNFNPVLHFDNNNSTAPGDMTYLLTDRDVLKGTGGFNSNDMFVVIIPDITVTNTMLPMDTFTGDDPDASTASYSEDVTGFGYGRYTARLSNEYLAYCIGGTSGTSPYPGYGSGDTSADTNFNKIGILNFRHNSGNTSQEIHLNATRIDDVENDAADFSAVNNSRYFIGRSQYWGGSFNGRIAEIITYSSTNSDTNDSDLRNRIQSYLAIKYGITLSPDSNGTTVDYVDSDGSVIWNQSASGYNHDIAGIGRDDASELNQKQSSSINDETDVDGPIEGILTIGLTDIYNTNSENISSNPTTFNDKEFLMWGNNGADLDLAASVISVDMSAGISGLSTPVTFTGMQRIWKFVETGGDVPSCKISIPQNAIRNISPPGSYLMFISDTPVFDPTADYRVMISDGSGNLETDYDFDGTKYITFGYAPQVIVERSIYFDGASDYIEMGDVLDLNTSEFTISAWIKRDSGTTNASILSKRDASNTEGYDFKINASGYLEFTINGGASTLTSSVVIPENEWHQAAVIFDNGNLSLYIDGVQDTSSSSVPNPVATSQSFCIAAADGNSPTALFAGNIDEVRVWNIALSVDQLRFIMNQEVEEDTTFVSGTVIPQSITKNEVGSIPWSDLEGYYPMSIYTYTNTNDMSGHNNQGALKNLDTVDYQTAPLPYETQGSGSWTTASTWLNNSVQTLPNATCLVGGTPIEWNIVEIHDDVTVSTYTSLGREVVVQGLSVDAGSTLEISGSTASNTGNGLTVTHYLKIDGLIDLEGESQLIQTTDSDFDSSSTGDVERDQQGTPNTYVYNYWSSPVAPTSNANYTIADVFSGLNFITTGYNGTSSPVAIADYWIWKYSNRVSNTYSQWQHVRSTGSLAPGEGFTMKGTGSTTANQNYVFNGQPNNGDINLTITAGNDYLVGNPYPSALDADEFILDNIGTADGGRNTSGNIINGALYFWDHFAINSHNLRDYQGGYASYTLIGGTVAISNDTRINASGASGTKLPERYVPVGQGFFVSATADPTLVGLSQPVVGGPLEFKNSQRTFVKENVSGSNTGSIFLKSKTKGTSSISAKTTNHGNPRIRLLFHSPEGYYRQLLVGSDSRATNNFDLGFDAPLIEDNKEDLYWIFDDNKFVIQGIANFETNQRLPLGIKVNKDGEAIFKIDSVENLDENFDIFIYDKLLDTYHNLKDGDYLAYVTTSTNEDRFELTFNSNSGTLTDQEFETGNIQVYYDNELESIVLINPELVKIETIKLYNVIGQLIKSFKIEDSTSKYRAFETSRINDGTYIINLISEGKTMTKKVLVK